MNSEQKKINSKIYGTSIFNPSKKIIENAFSMINKNKLFQVGFGYSSKNKTEESHASLIKNIVAPMYKNMKKNIIESETLKPIMLYGFYKTITENDILYFFNERNIKIELPLERMKNKPYKSIIDFYEKTGDTIAFTLVSVGEEYHKFIKTLYKNDEYKNYYFYSSLGTYLAESLASILNYELEEMLGINTKNKYKKHNGCRYSFGYKSLENMYGNKIIYDTLKGSQHGINLSESYMFEPEFTTASFICFSKNAHYFTN